MSRLANSFSRSNWSISSLDKFSNSLVQAKLKLAIVTIVKAIGKWCRGTLVTNIYKLQSPPHLSITQPHWLNPPPMRRWPWLALDFRIISVCSFQKGGKKQIFNPTLYNFHQNGIPSMPIIYGMLYSDSYSSKNKNLLSSKNIFWCTNNFSLCGYFLHYKYCVPWTKCVLLM